MKLGLMPVAFGFVSPTGYLSAVRGIADLNGAAVCGVYPFYAQCLVAL